MPPGLTRDAIVVKRADTSTDPYGEPSGPLATVYDGRGTWGSPSRRDLEAAEGEGATVNATVATAWPGGQKGDEVTVRGRRYRVEAAMDVRTHWRLLMSRLP